MGEAIRELQGLLKTKGYDPGPLDGMWGPRTASAYERHAPGAFARIEPLELATNAHEAALLLSGHFPTVRYTSGRRGVADQARAMAQNVAKNRKWIGATYVPTSESQRLQLWVSRNPQADTVAEIAAGLQSIMEGWSDAEKAHLSKHFSGQAFDVQPVSGTAGTPIKARIRQLPQLQKFLEREGGLVRWHAQFV